MHNTLLQRILFCPVASVGVSYLVLGLVASATSRSILFEDPPFPVFGRSDPLVKICRQCLAKSPDLRPTAADALRLLDGKCACAPSKQGSFDLAGNMNRASAYLQAGDAGKAETLLLSCLQNQPWSLFARVNLSEVYLSSNQEKNGA